MVYVAADLKCYRSAKKFNSTISKTLMLDTHSCVFLRISLSPNCISNSELFNLCSRKRIPEKTTSFVLILFINEKTMAVEDQTILSEVVTEPQHIGGTLFRSWGG